MITVRRPQPGDIAHISAHAAEPAVRIEKFDFEAVGRHPHTLVGELAGEPVAAAGFVEIKGGAVAWSIISDRIPKREFVPFVRLFRAHLRRAPFTYIEAHCRCDYLETLRWVRCLGFVPISDELLALPDGRVFQRFVFARDDADGN